MKEAICSKDKIWLKVHEIPIGSKWMAADGGNYFHIVKSVDAKTGDVTVEESVTNTIKTIDFFKLQYRYYLVDG